jgi:hypothetical protein
MAKCYTAGTGIPKKSGLHSARRGVMRDRRGVLTVHSQHEGTGRWPRIDKSNGGADVRHNLLHPDGRTFD